MAIASLRQEGAEALVADLRRDKVAKSSRATVCSLWRTWQYFHAEAFGDTVDVLPITPETLVMIGAIFKRGDYRSFPNYATVVKNAHVEANYPWDQLLEHTRAWVTRSVLRGIGPCRQSCSFIYSKLLKLPQCPAPLTMGGLSIR